MLLIKRQNREMGSTTHIPYMSKNEWLVQPKINRWLVHTDLGTSLKGCLHWRLFPKPDPHRSAKVITDLTVCDENRQQHVKLLTKKS